MESVNFPSRLIIENLSITGLLPSVSGENFLTASLFYDILLPEAIDDRRNEDTTSTLPFTGGFFEFSNVMALGRLAITNRKERHHMAIKEFDTVIMPNGRIGTLVDVYADGKKGIVEDMEMIGDEYKLYDVLISELREVPDNRA